MEFIVSYKYYEGWGYAAMEVRDGKPSVALTAGTGV
jgi:hypothetical protein